MLTFKDDLKDNVALEPCDMRKSFEGLQALVVTNLAGDLRGGAVFGFVDGSCPRVKLLHRDGGGLWVHAG